MGLYFIRVSRYSFNDLMVVSFVRILQNIFQDDLYLKISLIKCLLLGSKWEESDVDAVIRFLG